jgi:hypothetical protein
MVNVRRVVIMLKVFVFIFLTLLILVLFLLLNTQNKQKVIQAFTIKDFMQNEPPNYTPIYEQKKSLIDKINDYFDTPDNGGNIDDSNGEDGGDDGGE